jgi:hypothetical protein
VTAHKDDVKIVRNCRSFGDHPPSQTTQAGGRQASSRRTGNFVNNPFLFFIFGSSPWASQESIATPSTDDPYNFLTIIMFSLQKTRARRFDPSILVCQSLKLNLIMNNLINDDYTQLMTLPLYIFILEIPSLVLIQLPALIICIRLSAVCVVTWNDGM